MTNTKDKYAELKSTDIDQWALNILNRFEDWRFSLAQSQAKAKSQVLIASLLSDLDVANRGWQSMDTAPKGGEAEMVTDPTWVEPPQILLLFEINKVSVGYWDWYYAEGGSGYEGGLAWMEPVSGERLDLNYDPPIGWMPLPNPPTDKGGSQ